MNCRKVNQLLSAYMDGELRGVEHRQVFEHLARCSECEQEYESFLQMKRMLGVMRTHQPSPDLQARIAYSVTWEEAQAVSRTPGMIWMRVRMQIQDLFASPQGLGLGAIAILGVYAIAHHLPTATAEGASSTIVWQRTPNSVTELTAGLAPSEPELFVRPPVFRAGEPSYPESAGFYPVSVRNLEPSRPVRSVYRLEDFQPR